MKKKLLTLLLAVCATSCLCFGLAACGEKEHTHSYTSEITTAATCTEAGVTTYTCSCGESYTEAIPAKGHTSAEAVKENEVAATCTTDGSYDSVVYCSVCEAEISRETKTEKATGHNYVNGVCTVCGDEEESSTFYYNILKSFVGQGGFSIVLDTDNTSLSYGNEVLTFNVGEVTYKFDENGNITEAWFNGEAETDGAIIVAHSNVVGIEVYLKDGVYYIKINDEGDLGWMRMSVDDMMAAEMDEAAALSFMIVRNMTPGLVALSNKVLSGNSVWINEVLEKVFSSVFTRQTENGEVTLSLDKDALKDTYHMISSSTISEVIDYYLGDGSYDAVQNLVSGFDKLTLGQIITYAENFTKISRTEVIKIINDACAAAGYEVDLSEYLTDDMLALTVDEIVSNYIGDESFALSEVAGGYLEQLKDSTLFELLESSGVDTTAITQNAEDFIELAAEILDVKLVADGQGNLKSVDISVNYDGEFEPDEDEHYKVTGELQIVNGGETDDSFVSELVEEVDGLYGNILVDGYRMDNIGEHSYYVDDRETVVDNSYAVVHIAEDGTVSLTVNLDIAISYSDYEYYDYEDHYWTTTRIYKGQYVLTDIMCYGVETVYRSGELVEGVYRYSIQGNAAEGSSISYTYNYYEDGELVNTYSYQDYPSTRIYYYSETAE